MFFFPYSMSSASSSSDVSSTVSSVTPSGASSASVGSSVGSSVTPGLIGATARLMNNLVLLAPGNVIAALNKAQILSSVTK